MSKPDIDLFRELSERFSLVRLHGKDPSTAEGKGWTDYCHKKRSFDEIGFRRGENAGLACGPASDVLGLDIDHPELFESACGRHGWTIPETRSHETGKNRPHFLFSYPSDGHKYGNLSKQVLGFDTRGDGGQLVAPGSIHPDTGQPYKVLHDVKPAPAPEWLLKLYASSDPAWTTVELDKDTGLIKRAGITEDVKMLIRDGRAVGSRSEAMMRCLSAMVKDRWSDDQILWAFYTQGIGGKFMDVRSNRDEWLLKQIRKVRDTTVRAGAGNGQQRVDTSEWKPEILPWPTLRSEALHGIAGEFVQLATRKSEADPAAVLGTFLPRFACEVGSSPFLMVGDTKHYARIFGAIVGATSKARKGTSHGPVARCFEGLSSLSSLCSPNRYLCAHSTPGPLSSGEGLIFAVRDPIEKADYDKKTKKTVTKVVDSGVSDKRLFVCDEELGGALSCTKREGNTLSTVLRCAWDHGDLDPLTKISKITATGSHIIVVGHITIAELRRKLEDAEAFNGFANRFLWICARRQGYVVFPEPMPDDELRAIQRRLFLIIQEARSIGQVTLSDASKQLWARNYPDISADHDGLVGAVINRAEAQVLRLSMIYALLDNSKVIDDIHMKAALAMWDYCKCSAEHIFHGFEADPITTKILQHVDECEEIEWMQLYALFSNHATKRTIDSAVNVLVSREKIKLETIPTSGRPKRILKRHSSEVSEQSEVSPYEDKSRNSGPDEPEMHVGQTSVQMQTEREVWEL